jgi:hypothetical protein
LYPNARKLLTGIWDTPYSYSGVGLHFTDYSPLVNPTNGAGAPPVITEKPFPTSTNPYPPISTDLFPPIITHPVPTAPVTDETESFSTALILALVIGSVIIVNISLLVYLKRKHFSLQRYVATNSE